MPAQPTVVRILESWVLHYTTTQLTNIPDKPQRNNKIQNTLSTIVNSINICREMADSLRTYFDFILDDLLLYNEEKEQYSTLKQLPAISSAAEKSLKDDNE